MSALTDFLIARIAEDEAAADRVEFKPYVGDGISQSLQSRVLAECEAKRRIVDVMLAFESAIGAQSNERTIGSLNGLRIAVKELALPYADHPDYREDWRP